MPTLSLSKLITSLSHNGKVGYFTSCPFLYCLNEKLESLMRITKVILITWVLNNNYNNKTISAMQNNSNPTTSLSEHCETNVCTNFACIWKIAGNLKFVNKHILLWSLWTNFGRWWLCFRIKFHMLLTLSCWTRICSAFANSLGPDQLASEEANWSGSALFAIQ